MHEFGNVIGKKPLSRAKGKPPESTHCHHHRRGAHIVILMTAAGAAGITACVASFPGGAEDVDSLPSLSVTEEVRIGSVDDPDVGFSRIRVVDVDRDGNIYVAESLDREIRVYDRSGVFLRRFGGNGEGPGEFQNLMWFGVVGDTVWALDPSQKRTTLFDRTGALLSLGSWEAVPVTHPTPGTSAYVVPFRMRSDGLFRGEMSIMAMALGRNPDAMGSLDSLRVPEVLFHASGAVVDTIGWEVFPPPGRSRPERIQVGSRQYTVPRPESDELLEVTHPHGKWRVERPVAPSDEAFTFSITRLGLMGDTLFKREFRYAPKGYPEQVLDSLAARLATSGSSGQEIDAGAVRRQIRDAMDFPEFQPPILAGVGGEDGTLWLRREDAGEGSYHWLVIDPDGSPRGHIDLPRRSVVQWVGTGGFVVIEPDEFDVPWVVRFRIEPSEPTRLTEGSMNG